MSERERMREFYIHVAEYRSNMNDAWYWKRQRPNGYQPKAHLEEMQRCVNRAREANRQAVRIWYGRTTRS